jgi:hypothetical protein
MSAMLSIAALAKRREPKITHAELLEHIAKMLELGLIAPVMGQEADPIYFEITDKGQHLLEVTRDER